MTTPALPKPGALSPSPPPPPLLLTIRFSASLPDLDLDILRPTTTTVISLKHLIRSRLDKSHARHRLRFIHGGKILPDTAVLSSVLRSIPPPPSATTTSPADSKGKSVPGRPTPSSRLYINCSIGDELTNAELDLEAQAALLPPPTSSQPTPRPGSGLSVSTSSASTPRGFDRLLATGFTASEVNQLRLQFRSIHSARFTPDTLPSPDSFRRMEDAWIDDNGAAVPGAAGAGANGAMGVGAAGMDSDEVGIVGMVDVLIRGVITGFIWPLGSAGWLIREDGMFSDRWRFMVGVGVIFGVMIGFIRAISGDR